MVVVEYEYVVVSLVPPARVESESVPRSVAPVPFTSEALWKRVVNGAPVEPLPALVMVAVYV